MQNNMQTSTHPLNQDEIKLYLKEVRKIKVMTPDREKELALLMADPNCDDITRDRIQKELLEGNLRFVISVAKQYQNQGMDMADLIAEGNYGMMKAIKNFDWSKGNRFISYAVWWVKQSILQSLNEHSRTIRLPVNVVQELHRAKKEIQKTDGELSDKLSSLPKVTQLDNFINQDEDTLIEMIPNDDSLAPDSAFDNKDVLKNELMNVLSVLDERERVIVEDYYGLSGHPRTLEDIGGDFNLTKERVRQIKEKALRKLRNEAGSLFDYL